MSNPVSYSVKQLPLSFESGNCNFLCNCYVISNNDYLLRFRSELSASKTAEIQVRVLALKQKKIHQYSA